MSDLNEIITMGMILSSYDGLIITPDKILQVGRYCSGSIESGPIFPVPCRYVPFLQERIRLIPLGLQSLNFAPGSKSTSTKKIRSE